ncbi:hypothetical protein [Bacteroides sp. An19]|uniref:hypothetical protein n=1 Tax=Bacteroides sp. An19 TaxID=1965580 RepID=UPI000B393571|nr:hypothetical protein [Bacteroides sp. An19]OUP37265.1 hypothetical protein B5F25_00265 [Bacteroides sp. An19]
MSKITKINVGGVDYELGGSGTGKMVEITHAELKALKDSSSLEVGTKYRITDYVGTFKTLKSANHPFDIVVEALSESVLSEKASAMQNERDKYFSNSKMELWEIWYSLENDNTRFSEASENGKGYIYKLKDEYGNDVCFDFKNALFTLTSAEYPFITASGGSMDFYLFSHNKGTTGVFSNQDDIEDFSNAKPDKVRDNYVNVSKLSCIILGLDNFLLESILSIKNNKILSDNVIYISKSGIIIDNLTASYKIYNRERATIRNCYFNTNITIKGDGDLLECDFFNFTSIEALKSNILKNEFYAGPTSGSSLKINCELRGCIVRLETSNNDSNNWELSESTLGASTLINKLIWGRRTGSSVPYEYEYKVFDPFDLTD